MNDFAPEVTQRFHGSPGQLADGVVGEVSRPGPVVLAEYDPAWARRFAAVEAELRAALGTPVVDVEHVGSTAVPGLVAKPIVDVDLRLAGTGDEAAYRPALERLGYRLVLREPWWYGHRMFVGAAGDVHLHVWPVSAAEPVRHRIFRDWLRDHPEDRERYAEAKRRLAAATADRPGDYSLAKNDVIDAVYERAFAAASDKPDVLVVHLDGPAMRALADGDLEAAEAVSPVPLSAWLAGPDCRRVWERRHAQFRADPATAAWVTGVVWDERRRLAVGAAGFHGPPDADGMVEIGYRVDDAYQRRGYARAALEALLARAAREPGVSRVRVSIRPDNAPSYGLASQYGFTKIGEEWDDEDGLEYVYERPA